MNQHGVSATSFEQFPRIGRQGGYVGLLWGLITSMLTYDCAEGVMSWILALWCLDTLSIRESLV